MKILFFEILTQRDLGRPRLQPIMYVLPLKVAHDTNLVYGVMMKYRRNGTCYLEGDNTGAFVNDFAAMMAAQVMQLYFAKRNLSTSLRINLSVGSIELTVHLDGPTYPVIPQNYFYSKKRISSHEYFSDFDKEVVRVRCLELIFTYNQTSF